MSNSSLFLSREVEVYINFDSKWWKVPVLDGFSFSQSTNTAEVTVKEMADSSNNSRRGRMMFNNSVSPAEFSFSTYARPVKIADSNGTPVTRHHAIEEVCWAMMGLAGAASYNDADDFWDDATTVQNNADGATVAFTASSSTRNRTWCGGKNSLGWVFGRATEAGQAQALSDRLGFRRSTEKCHTHKPRGLLSQLGPPWHLHLHSPSSHPC